MLPPAIYFKIAENLSETALWADGEGVKSTLSGNQACVVCSQKDARTLSTVSLKDGSAVVVCGSHELAYKRHGQKAKTASELKKWLADRRDSERRLPEVDELGAQLTAAFSNERREGRDRRRTA